jgi:protein TonB
MTLALEQRVADGSGSFAPAWARAAMLAAIVAAHAWAFLRLSSEVPVTPLPAIAIDFVPLPDAPPPEAQPDLPPPEPAMKPPPPPEEAVPAEAPPSMAPPPPPVIDAVPPPLPKPEPAPNKPPPKPQPLRKPAPVPKPAKPAPRAETRPTPVRPASAAAPRNAAPAAASAPAEPAMSTAAYAGLVAAELNRHKVYPEAARASGASGSVGVAFTIGPSGHPTAIAVTVSSGNAALDSAARQAVASVHVPPPPGGIFRTATTIRFSLR